MSFGVSIYSPKKGHFVGIGVWEREREEFQREREGLGLGRRGIDAASLPLPFRSIPHSWSSNHLSLTPTPCLSLLSIYFPLHFFTHISRVSFWSLFPFQIWTSIVPTMASKRILKELKDLQKDPPTSCSAGISFSSSFHSRTTIFLCPLNVSWKKSFFFFSGFVFVFVQGLNKINLYKLKNCRFCCSL